MAIGLDIAKEVNGALLRVIGVGGGGGNAINSMIQRGISNVDFVAVNTDIQALEDNLAPFKIQVGKERTRGLGAGADPEVGREAVEESMEDIKQALKHSDMVFITAGMGGGTGTGGAPVISKIARDMGALVVGIVTKPFKWEGITRIKSAENGIKQLREYVDALIVIPNNKLLDVVDKNTSFSDAFFKVDEVLYNATKSIADIIFRKGYINVDFADVRTIMKASGDALMGVGIGKGENRTIEAAQMALCSPLLDGISINGAKGILLNIAGGSDLTMSEIAEASDMIQKAAGDDYNLIQGIVLSDKPTEEVMVTVIATGFNKGEVKHHIPYGQVEVENVQSSYDSSLYERNQHLMDRNKPTIPIVAINSDSNKKYTQKTTYRFEAAPKGTAQLRKLETPAVERLTHYDTPEDSYNGLTKESIMNSIPNQDNNDNSNKFSNIKNINAALHDKIEMAQKNNTFIQRIMD